MKELSQQSCGINSFEYWQADYAAHGIATFPVEFIPRADGRLDKKPMVSRYNRIGHRASFAIARRYPDARGIGFMAGRRNGVTIGDVDEVGEKPLQRFLDRHGSSPDIARTASGKHHVWYRHNGERRVIRPERGINVDVLGNGFVVAPPSHIESGRYQFIQGSLDDLRRLPIMQNVPQAALPSPAPTGNPDVAEMREGDGRNNTLFRIVGRGAHHVDDFDQLLDYARTRNSEFAQPLPDEEVLKVATSVWKMQCEGRNRFGRPGVYFPAEEAVPLIDGDPDLFRLISFIRATQGPDSEFMLANGMCERWNWPRQRFAAVRARAIAVGEIYCVRKASQHTPALYRRSRVRVSNILTPILNRHPLSLARARRESGER
jgi:hypothetical protein